MYNGMDIPKIKTKVGQRYGLLVALEPFKRPTSYGKNVFYKCQCDCGKIAEVHSDHLRTKGGAKSCGCRHWYGSRTIDWTNQKINRLTPLYPTNKRAGKSIIWVCKCECGNKKEIAAGEFASGKTKSCGCLRLENKPVKYNPNRFESMMEDIYMDGIVKRSKAKGWEPPTVTLEDFHILSQRRCSYCNAYPSNTRKGSMESDPPLKYNGLDRLDSSLPYLIDNVVPCCWACNQMKFEMSIDEFLDKIVSIYEKDRSAFKIDRDFGRSLISEYNTCHQTLYNSKIIKRTREMGFSLENLLSLEEYASLTSQSCYYCDKESSQSKTAYGRTLRFNGIDRRDSDVGYITDNCVPCCSQCNNSKQDMKEEVFLRRVDVIITFLAPFKINRENVIRRILANNPLMKNPAV